MLPDGRVKKYGIQGQGQDYRVGSIPLLKSNFYSVDNLRGKNSCNRR